MRLKAVLVNIGRMFGWLSQLIFPATKEPLDLSEEPPLPPVVEPEPTPEPEPAPEPVPPAPDPPTPPAWVAPLPPIQGQLRCDGQSFLDDTGRRVPIFCHAGDLILQFVEARTQGDQAKDARIHQAFLDMQRAGYSGLRSWWSISWTQPNAYWGNRRLNPSDHEHRRLIRECLRIGAEDYNLRWHIALGSAENVPRGEMDDAWGWMAAIIHEHPHWFALVEGLNEACHTGQRDPDEVERWVNISRHRTPEVLHILSAGEGAAGSEEELELEKWTPEWQPLFYSHAYRANHWGDQTRHAFSVAYNGHPPRRLGWSGEPPGINWDAFNRVSGMNRAHEWTERSWRYVFYLAHTAMARQIPTYMCSHGVVMEGRFKDAPGFEMAPRLINDLPSDVHTYQHIFHGGTRWKEERIIVAPEHARADHVRADDGRAVISIYPERPDVHGVDIVVEKAWRGRVHDSVGWTDVVMEKGARWHRDISSGLLLIGEVL